MPTRGGGGVGGGGEVTLHVPFDYYSPDDDSDDGGEFDTIIDPFDEGETLIDEDEPGEEFDGWMVMGGEA